MYQTVQYSQLWCSTMSGVEALATCASRRRDLSWRMMEEVDSQTFATSVWEQGNEQSLGFNLESGFVILQK
jgi:hypothetical protein